MRVKKKTPTYKAEILEGPVNIGGLQGRKGDYILKGSDGSKTVAPREDLMRDYVPHDQHAHGGIWGYKEPRWDSDNPVQEMDDIDSRDIKTERLDLTPPTTYEELDVSPE